MADSFTKQLRVGVSQTVVGPAHLLFLELSDALLPVPVHESSFNRQKQSRRRKPTADTVVDHSGSSQIPSDVSATSDGTAELLAHWTPQVSEGFSLSAAGSDSGRGGRDTATRTPAMTSATEVFTSSGASRGSGTSGGSRVFGNTASSGTRNSGNSDQSSVVEEGPSGAGRGSQATSEEVQGQRSPSSSEFEFSAVPGLSSDSRGSGSGYSLSDAEDSGAPAQNSLAAHMSGTCKPCRFFQLKDGGCRLGDACRFCHLCTREEARAERLRIKYDDRRAKRRQGIRRR